MVSSVWLIENNCPKYNLPEKSYFYLYFMLYKEILTQVTISRYFIFKRIIIILIPVKCMEFV